ncbi:MAG: NADPH-dependent 7-cyano-7-deazaguanine reductase QueF [Gammaproteobacteria bacterium]|nr:NADPH-dependent 7-cyano-7-deazaguanine reductase QueF [Gammaproteobacteria bacterium]
MANIPLGKSTVYPTAYDPKLLFPVARKEKRDEIGIADPATFYGADYWTAYEMSWLNSKGKPEVAIAEFEFDRNTPCIIESKSFKLYLNSFNQEIVSSWTEFEGILLQDLRKACGSEKVKVNLLTLEEYSSNGIVLPDGILLDSLDIECDVYDYSPELLAISRENKANSENVVSESVYTHLLKSNCLITSQPDWATLLIDYTGIAINHEALLKYVVSFRGHDEFHEQCVERIFQDIMRFCRPEKLSVYARYTRRGGLDINPWRSTEVSGSRSFSRLARQ